MNSIDRTKQRIRVIIKGSQVPEDPDHAENTLEWVLRLKPDAGEALQIAALGHDLDRALERDKVQRTQFDDYDVFKAAHARNSARHLRQIMDDCGVPKSMADEACRLVFRHEVGGDPLSDLLKDADAISYFEVNLPLYFQRHGWAETLRRSVWGYRRLSENMRSEVVCRVYDNPELNKLLKETVRQA